MNTYLLARNGSVGWDEYDAAVITAESENAAREIAQQELNDGVTNWMDKEKVSVMTITSEERGIVLSSFNAG